MSINTIIIPTESSNARGRTVPDVNVLEDNNTTKIISTMTDKIAFVILLTFGISYFSSGSAGFTSSP